MTESLDPSHVLAALLVTASDPAAVLPLDLPCEPLALLVDLHQYVLAAMLDDPYICELMTQALKEARVNLKAGCGGIVLKSKIVPSNRPE